MNEKLFESTYSNLPEAFYQKLSPTSFPDAKIIKWNSELDNEFKISKYLTHDNERALLFSGQKIDYGALPIAQAYSGHQFGHFNPHLGDGRALLLGEIRNAENVLFDVHLKGSGQTQFSRRGDGRANLAAVIREYIVSESMNKLNIPTSRTLALIKTGESVEREDFQPGAILVRMAKSHIRIGTFEYFIARGDINNAKILANYVIDRMYPKLEKNEECYLQLFENIIQSQASLVSKWMNVGFIHGVMNTDNTFISGETLDYGPCAFMEEFNPDAVFSSIDKNGRYSYKNQPPILQWNLSCLGECFFQFIETKDKKSLKNKIETLIDNFQSQYQKLYLEELSKKFGFFDEKLFLRFESKVFFNFLYSNKIDYTLGFRRLSSLLNESPDSLNIFTGLDKNWIQMWRSAIMSQNKSEVEIKNLINSVNPIYIPRNHLVEKSIQLALNHDFSFFEKVIEVTSNPYVENIKFNDFSLPAKPTEKVTKTYCNT